MKNNTLLIFDCDGTLLDTFSLIMESVKLTFERYLKNHKLTEDERIAFFGPSLKFSFSKYVPKKQVDDMISKYRQISKELTKKYVKAFPNIFELLTILKKEGYKLSILSNKVTDAIVFGLKLTNIDSFFDKIVGYEQLVVPKPDANGIDLILNHYQVKPEHIYLIGDTIIDIQTGKNSSHLVKTVGVTWCNTSKETFQQVSADYIIDNPLELLTILEDKNDI